MKKDELIDLIKNEGDFEEFEYNGLKCVIQRNRHKIWCGYVGITPDFSLYGFDYNMTIPIPDEIKDKKINIDKLSSVDFFIHCLKVKAGEASLDEFPISVLIEVHGGITFSESALADGRTWNGKKCEKFYGNESDNLWWFGFDCGHSGDLIPTKSVFNNTGEQLLINNNEIYRTKEYAINETKALADQLITFKLKK